MVISMITYEIQYKCYLSNKHPNLPLLRYKYRESGKVLWERKETVEIDKFASLYWGREYYEGSLRNMTTYNRVCTIREILNREYGGNLKNYVRAMAEFEIVNDMIDRDEENEAYEISLSFITDGWEETTVKLRDTTY